MAELQNLTVQNNSGIILPSGASSGRPGSPTAADIRFNTDIGSVEGYDGISWKPRMIGLSSSTAAINASEIKYHNPHAPSGVYWIKWNGTTPVQIYCEMNLHGGAWMMILNYVHGANTNPALTVRTSNFPLLNREYEFGDESSSTDAGGTWGHISNSLANQHAWTQYMFYGRTSLHNRVIHFHGDHPDIVSYIKTGSGSMSPHYADASRTFNGSLRLNSTIPLDLLSTDITGFSNQGDYAMTAFPMYGDSNIENPRAHWGIGYGGRWEVDDYPSQQGSTSSGNNTIHRVFVR